jgi:hypothetical protein
VRAKETASQAYSYYNPQMQGETLSQAVTVVDAAHLGCKMVAKIGFVVRSAHRLTKVYCMLS